MFEIVVDTEVMLGGASRTVRVAVRREELSEFGLVCDFHQVRKQVTEFSQSWASNESNFETSLFEHLNKLCEAEEYLLYTVDLT